MGGATVGDYCGKVAVTASGAIRMLGWKGVGMAQEIRMKLTINGTPRVRRIVAAIDCGQPVNPDGIAQQVEGAIVYGLSAALKEAITIKGGAVEQANFHDFELLRINEMPVVEVHIIPSTEPGLPPAAPAVANAIFAATGKRLRTL